MNDLFIITVCIFLLILTWSIYFKKFFKEGNEPAQAKGNDPAQANYTMPISFSDDGTNKTINIPPKVTTNGKNLILDPDTTIVGETILNKSLSLNPKKQITFGDGTAISTNNQLGRDKRNELEIVGVGTNSNGNYIDRKIHMWDDVEVERNLKVYSDVNSNSINTGSSNVTGNSTTKSLGVADSTATGSLNVTNNTTTGSLNVTTNTTTDSLNVKGNTKTDSLNIKDKQNIGGMQFGRCDGNMPNREAGKPQLNENKYGWCSFNKPFNTDSVFIFTNRNGGESYNPHWPHGCSRIGQTNVWGQNRNGFYFRSGYVNDKGNYQCYFGPGDYPFFWFAIAADN